MRFDQEKISGVTVIRVREKKLTSHEAPAMKTSLLGFIISEGERFLINLKDVQMMDSTGLGSFLFGIRQAERYDKDVRFCEVQPKIQFLIRIAHLDQVIQVYNTEKEALEAFNEEDKDD